MSTVSVPRSVDPDLADVKWTGNVKPVEPDTAEEVLTDFISLAEVARDQRILDQRVGVPLIDERIAERTSRVRQRRLCRKALEQSAKECRQYGRVKKLPRIDADEIRSLSPRVARILSRTASGATDLEATEPEGVRWEAVGHILRVLQIRKVWLRGEEYTPLRFDRLMKCVYGKTGNALALESEHATRLAEVRRARVSGMETNALAADPGDSLAEAIEPRMI